MPEEQARSVMRPNKTEKIVAVRGNSRGRVTSRVAVIANTSALPGCEIVATNLAS